MVKIKTYDLKKNVRIHKFMNFLLYFIFLFNVLFLSLSLYLYIYYIGSYVNFKIYREQCASINITEIISKWL